MPIEGRKRAQILSKDYNREILFDVAHEEQSRFQHIYIGKNGYLGRMLILDNQIQFSELDYKVYHEMMVWPSMMLRKGDSVGIYGGGDGLAAGEILKFGVRPTVVDLDARVVELCKEYFPDLHCNSFGKSDVIIGDALKHRPERKFDVLFMDLTDQREVPFLYEKAAMEKYKADLSPGGIILFYAEYHIGKEFYGLVGKYFRHSFTYGCFMPAFSNFFTYGMFSDSPIDAEKLRKTEKKGDYFCKAHIWETDFSRIPVPKIEEEYKITGA
jgi:spermidine synthase